MRAPRKYPQELKERGVRLALESNRPIAQVAKDLGIQRESLRRWVRQAEADAGARADLLTTSEREELKQLRSENRELRRANEDTTHCPPRGLPGAGADRPPASPTGGSLS